MHTLKNSGDFQCVNDEQIIALYWARQEAAIAETALKYGGLCTRVAGNILASREDSEESVNDTYFAVWNAIPEQRPQLFPAFISRVTRNLALKKYEYLSAAKRNPAAVISFEELGECVSGRDDAASDAECRQVERAINAFLWQQGEEKRNLFIRRYWYFDSIESISGDTGFSQSKVKSILYEMRRRLRAYLESEGIEV